MATTASAWGTVRASLAQVSFAEIKTIAGLAGLDLTRLADLQQNQGPFAVRH